MAVRSGAGTGVIVSLVVFVLTTIFLLILSIVFYVGKSEALEKEAAARNDLNKYVSAALRNDERFKSIEQAAGGRPVSAHLMGMYDDLSKYVTGTNARSLDEIKADLEKFDVRADGSIRGALEELSRRVRNLENERDSLAQKVKDRDEALAEKDRTLARTKEEHAAELARVSTSIEQYGSASREYGEDVRKTIDSVNRGKEELRTDYEDRITDLEDEIDRRGQDLVVTRSRIDEYERIMSEIRVRGTRPELLVDSKVLDVDPANDQIFIDRGRQDRIVLGMNFEVYDDAAAIRPDARGLLPRGKATVQVVKIGEKTATCKITRSVPGRPVVRNNVLANAVYDPDRTFKFMVHGKFDVDGDGRPTEAEAEYLRSQILAWGGQVVEGDVLPGDLDFLLLGEEPPLPPPLPTDPTQAQVEIWTRQRAAQARYQELFDQAREAQIPVLNANRFFILTGLGAQ